MSSTANNLVVVIEATRVQLTYPGGKLLGERYQEILFAVWYGTTEYAYFRSSENALAFAGVLAGETARPIDLTQGLISQGANQ